jgi:hypothetical protein
MPSRRRRRATVDLVRRLVFDGLSEQQVAMLESFVTQVLSRLAEPESDR